MLGLKTKGETGWQFILKLMEAVDLTFRFRSVLATCRS